MFAYRREHDGDAALVVLNFTDAEQEVALPRPERWSFGLSTLLDDAARPRDGAVTLRPHEGAVLLGAQADTGERRPPLL